MVISLILAGRASYYRQKKGRCKMIKINKNDCIGCGRCVTDCIADNLILRERKAEALGDCILCGHCVAICPAAAVSIPEYDMADVEELTPDAARLDTNRLLNAIKFRRSIRSFQSVPVTQKHIELLIEAGRYTATAKNAQDCRFILVQKELETFKALIWSQIGRQLEAPDHAAFEPYREFYQMYLKDSRRDYLFRNAPAVLFIAANDSTDSGLAAQNMELMGTSLGIGFLYNGYLRRAADIIPDARAWLGAKDRGLGVCALLGYPAVTYLRTAPRRRADAILR